MLFRSLAQSLRVKLIERWATLRTDEQGRIAIPFLQLEGMSQKVGLKWSDGSSTDFVLEVNDDWRVVRPR